MTSLHSSSILVARQLLWVFLLNVCFFERLKKCIFPFNCHNLWIHTKRDLNDLHFLFDFSLLDKICDYLKCHTEQEQWCLATSVTDVSLGAIRGSG